MVSAARESLCSPGDVGPRLPGAGYGHGRQLDVVQEPVPEPQVRHARDVPGLHQRPGRQGVGQTGGCRPLPRAARLGRAHWLRQRLPGLARVPHRDRGAAHPQGLPRRGARCAAPRAQPGSRGGMGIGRPCAAAHPLTRRRPCRAVRQASWRSTSCPASPRGPSWRRTTRCSSTTPRSWWASASTTS